MQGLGVIAAVLAVAVQVESAARLVVQVVDTTWTPVQGVSVRLVEVVTCSKPEEIATSLQEEDTRADGSSDFNVRPQTSYLIVAQAEGLETRQVCVRSNSSAAYVQVRLRPDLSKRVALAIPGLRSTPGSQQLTLGDLVGVYRDTMGRFYEVTVLEGGDGLEVSYPDGRVIAFPFRDETRFEGSNGVVTFDVIRGRIGMTLTSLVVDAQKQD